MKIVLYSAGQMSKTFIADNKSATSENEIIAVVDSDEKKQNNFFEGYRIQHPQIISELSYDVVIVPSYKFFTEIKNELINQLNVEESKIGDFTYLQKWFAEKEAKRHYEGLKIENFKTHINSKKKVVVYTAIFGNYDVLKEPEYIGDDVDYVCFTDNPQIKSDVWKVIYCENDDKFESRIKAKEFKCLPHKFLSDYEVSVWIDGSIQVKGNISKFVFDKMSTSDLLFFAHPWRNCIYDEAEYTLKERKFENVIKTEKQIEQYSREGMPHNNGLVCGGFIARYHNVDKVKYVMEHWWEQLQKHGLNDQISLGYVLWKYGLNYDVVGDWIYDNELITIKDHLVLDR